MTYDQTIGEKWFKTADGEPAEYRGTLETTAPYRHLFIIEAADEREIVTNDDYEGEDGTALVEYMKYDDAYTIDQKVSVWNEGDVERFHAHYAGEAGKRPTVWKDGKTSWTASLGETIAYDNIEPE